MGWVEELTCKVSVDGRQWKHISEFINFIFFIFSLHKSNADRVEVECLQFESTVVLYDGSFQSILMYEINTTLRREKERSVDKAVHIGNLRCLLGK